MHGRLQSLCVCAVDSAPSRLAIGLTGFRLQLLFRVLVAQGSDQIRQAFSKRKKGLVLKAYQLSSLTDAKVRPVRHLSQTSMLMPA